LTAAAATAAPTVALYFVATPLHYLAARRVALSFEADARQVLVWYRPNVERVVRAADWDAASYMPWPRFEPLPGWFGRHRRLRENIRRVAQLVGRCERLHIHSPVFDTESINYFLRALPAACGASTMHARILPDGLGSMVRQPLGPARRLAQRLRRLRRLVAPELDFWVYDGDRTGADAPFCDRVYVLHGFPHPYPVHKTVSLPPLADAQAARPREAGAAPRALVVGQPLEGIGQLDAEQVAALTHEIHDWLAQQGITEILYKAHPRDPRHELRHRSDRLLEIDEPLEAWMSREPCDAVVGVHSTALLMARQIYGPSTQVVGFGWDRVRFRSVGAKQDALAAFQAAGVTLREGRAPR